MTPTPEQSRVCDWVATGTGNAIVDACAGGAKTTTLVLAAQRLEKGKLNLCFAFNKDIATTLQARLPYWVTASTWHSHCYDALGRHLGGKPKLDARKTSHILKELVPEWKARREIEDDVVALVSRAKAFGWGVNGLAEDAMLGDLAERFDLAPPLDLVEEVLVRSRTPSVIDFDDMLWLTLLLGAAVGAPDFVFVDEAQDTNVVQRALLKRMLTRPQAEQNHGCRCAVCGTQFSSDAALMAHKQGACYRPTGGRLLAVGDPHQSIYGFRGADSDAMTALAHDFACERMALSVSWRCSKAVVAEAQKHL